MMILTVPAFAAERFQDVDASSPWYEGINFAAEQGISVGTGNGNFSPNQNISVRQWSAMVCRALGKQVEVPEGKAFDLSCVERGYREGWIPITGMMDPDSAMCRASALESAFNACGIDLYSYELYEGGSKLCNWDNCMRVSKEYGICEPESKGNEVITRGEAVQILYQFMTTDIRIDEPPILGQMNIVNTDELPLDPYLLEIIRIPAPILEEFQKRGWSYHLDCEYIAKLSEELNMNCVGAANYAKKRITVAEPSATLHEFGHFLHQVVGFPSVLTQYYELEADAFVDIFREYSGTNVREFFADYFYYWMEHSQDTETMARLQAATPKTFAYFTELEAGGWVKKPVMSATA